MNLLSMMFFFRHLLYLSRLVDLYVSSVIISFPYPYCFLLVCLSAFLSISPSLSLYLSIYLSNYLILSLSHPIFLSISFSPSHSHSLSPSLFVCVFSSIYIFLSLSLPMCIFFPLWLSRPIFPIYFTQMVQHYISWCHEVKLRSRVDWVGEIETTPAPEGSSMRKERNLTREREKRRGKGKKKSKKKNRKGQVQDPFSSADC